RSAPRHVGVEGRPPGSDAATARAGLRRRAAVRKLSRLEKGRLARRPPRTNGGSEDLPLLAAALLAIVAELLGARLTLLAQLLQLRLLVRREHRPDLAVETRRLNGRIHFGLDHVLRQRRDLRFIGGDRFHRFLLRPPRRFEPRHRLADLRLVAAADLTDLLLLRIGQLELAQRQPEASRSGATGTAASRPLRVDEAACE